jgi:hypothetical protein
MSRADRVGAKERCQLAAQRVEAAAVAPDSPDRSGRFRHQPCGSSREACFEVMTPKLLPLEGIAERSKPPVDCKINSLKYVLWFNAAQYSGPSTKFFPLDRRFYPS